VATTYGHEDQPAKSGKVVIDIFNANWDDFSDTLRSRRAMEQTLSQFNQLRNVIAHSCDMNDDEITRLTLVINDWLRIQTWKPALVSA